MRILLFGYIEPDVPTPVHHPPSWGTCWNMLYRRNFHPFQSDEKAYSGTLFKAVVTERSLSVRFDRYKHIQKWNKEEGERKISLILLHAWGDTIQK
jgi:hypothetical protein